MARGGTESAYRGEPSPTTRDDVHGFVNRLLRKRHVGRGDAHAAREKQHKPAVTLAPAAALHQQDTTASACQPEPALATPTLGLKMPSVTPQPQPEPQLKKKASFRDRLKTWQKPPPQPLEMVAEELKPRFVYEPTHAAADFSRIVVSPSGAGWQGLASPIQPLTGDKGVPARRASQTRARDGGRTRRDEIPARQRRPNARSEAKRHSHTPAEDPFSAANTAAHAPPTDSHPATALGKTAQQAPQPLSDYELFIARAEADDRQRREQMQQMLRSMSQRSAAAAASKVRPDPHQQFAAASSSAERSRHVSGRGGRSEQQQQEQRHETRRGHARHASWAPTSSTAGGGSSERAPPQKPQALQQQQQQKHLPHAPPEPIAYAVEEDNIKNGHHHEYQPQPPRTLRRQASLTKRIVEYIRPSKSVGRTVETLVE